MAIDKRKLTSSFGLPIQSVVNAFASLLDFTHSDCQEYSDEVLSRSIADDIREDWEAVGESLWWAIAEHERRNGDGKAS